MHEVLVNRLGGLSLPRKSVVRLTDGPDMTIDVYRGHKPTIQQYNNNPFLPGNLLKDQRQTVQTQIRCHIMWHLIRVYIVVVVVALLFYVHGKHLRSCRDGQLT